jgi:hypothetical protein
MNNNNLTGKAGGRKALGFYAALGCCFLLAMSGKASTEVLALINTLYVSFVGANVWAKKVSPTEVIQAQAQAQAQIKQPQTQDTLEKP